MYFYIYQLDDGSWSWRLLSSTNRIIADSPDRYPGRDACRAFLEEVRKHAHALEVLEMQPGKMRRR